jgi:hypothetical protein
MLILDTIPGACVQFREQKTIAQVLKASARAPHTPQAQLDFIESEITRLPTFSSYRINQLELAIHQGPTLDAPHIYTVRHDGKTR